jgi:hypothetical protein
MSVCCICTIFFHINDYCILDQLLSAAVERLSEKGLLDPDAIVRTDEATLANLIKPVSCKNCLVGTFPTTINYCSELPNIRIDPTNVQKNIHDLHITVWALANGNKPNFECMQFS